MNEQVKKINRIKILLICSRNIFNQNSASANRWRSMVEGLSNEGAEVQIVFTHGFSSMSEFREYGWSGEVKKIKYLYSIFFLHNSLWMRRLSSYLFSPLFVKYNANIIREIISDFQPQIVWLQPILHILEEYITLKRKEKHINYKLMLELN